MIKNIVFDFGDVLVKDATKLLEKKYKFNSLPVKKQKKYILDCHKAEIGKISTLQLLKTIHQTLDPKESPKQIEEYVTNTYLLPPWKLAKKLSKNYKIIIFSNNQKLWPKIMAKKLKTNFFQFPFINSAYKKMRKPKIQFYKYLLTSQKLKPNETIFIDDKLKNILPAKKLGIHTFQYSNNHVALRQFLKRHSVKI
jgi:HAD superfamily hydrolase (TIGR01509 family)